MQCNNSAKIGKKEITCLLKAMEVTRRIRRIQQPIQQLIQLLNQDLKERRLLVCSDPEARPSRWLGGEGQQWGTK